MGSRQKIVEQCKVSPPAGSVPTTSVPLTFLDLPWLALPYPVQRLYFYKFPHPTVHFTQTLLPPLKHSLSLTLQHFYPLAGNITSPPPPTTPHILYSAAHSAVPFTAVESPADFNLLIGNHPRHVKDFDHLVPHLPQNYAYSNHSDTFVLPILALQATIFPNSGICIALSYRHVVDGRTANHFMKCWASVYRSRGQDLSCIHESPPVFDRNVIRDTNGLEPILFEQYISLRSTWKNVKSDAIVADPSTNVRATFVLGGENIERLKEIVVTQSKELDNVSAPKHLSKFVVACAYVWVCLMKAQDCTETGITSMKGEELLQIAFVGDVQNRLPFAVPRTYFGNCLAAWYVAAEKRELVAEQGVLKAAKALEGGVVEVKKGNLEGLKRMVSYRRELAVQESCTAVAGSPHLGVYGTDFGWGRPEKVEVVHFVNSRTFALSESRDEEDGIEIGLALSKPTMAAFAQLFEHGLNLLDLDLN